MYTVYYDFLDPYYNHRHSGIWIVNSLAEVESFCAMVKRYGGSVACQTGTLGTLGTGGTLGTLDTGTIKSSTSR